MNTDEVFKMLLEASPERVGRVGYLRKLNAEKAKKSAEFWNNDDAWAAAKKAQAKYDSHTASVEKHMKKFSRDRDSDWAKKLAAGYKGEETDVKNMRRNIKIGAGVGLGLAGAYGAYRLLRGKKKPVEKEKATTPTKTVAPKKHVIDTRQDPTEPASYPFKDSASTDAVWANLMEGIWGRIKGAAAGLRDKLRDKVLDKYVAPAIHAGVKFPGAEPHDSVTQGRITRMYRALGGKGISPTLVRHKGNTGMAYMKVPAIGAPDGKLPVIAAPARGTRVVGQLRRGKGAVAGFHNSSGITHEVGHAALTSKGDVSHKRMPMVDALNKRHPKNVFGGIAKLDPKTYATQSRLHMRAEGRNNTFLGTSKNRLRAAKKSMTAATRALYDDVKKHAPDAAPGFVQRYKNFRRAWRKGSPTAHLKLSTDATWANLMEVSRGLLHRARIAAGAKMERIKIAQNRLRSAPNFLGDQELGGNPIYNARNAWRDDVVKSIKGGEKKIIGATKVAPGTYHKLGPQMGAKYDVTNRSSASRYRFDIHSRKARGVDGIANQIYDSGYGKAEKQFWRFDDAIKRPKNYPPTKTPNPDNPPKWGKRAAVGLGIAAAGYGAYRLNKWRKGRKKEVKESEYLPGGRAEGKSSRIFPKGQLRMGRRVEMEHTRNPRVAEEIAKDHLAEFKDYYTRLAQMEREAKRSQR